MILEIKKAVFNKLKSTFADHKLYGEKVIQGLIRPCFFVDIIPIDIERINPSLQKRSIMVDVQYLSLEDTKQKNLEMSEMLIDLFDTLTLVDKDVRLVNQRFELFDGILHFLFDLDILIILKDNTNDPMIGQIYLNEEVN